MRYDTLQYAVADGVATVALARPDARNALDAQMRSDLAHAFRRAGGEARAVVLTALGEAFSAGQGLGDAGNLRDLELGRTQREETAPMIEAMQDCGAPIVAAVNGPASGAGAALALSADLVIAGESASFAFPGARIGMPPDAGVSWWLPRAVGPARAMGLYLFGQSVPAAQAADWGLIWACVPDPALSADAARAARALAQGPTQALLAARRLMRDGAARGFSDQLEAEAEALALAAGGREFLEGAVAQAEDRPPAFGDP
ncbi:MAG: enoyl-CoA hydratase-related protein [Pseudomonadota bacterium]